MKISDALEPVIGELVVDKLHTYLAELVVEDLLVKSKDVSDWHRYLALESIVALMHRTDSRYTALRAELARLKKKYRRHIGSQRKKLLSEWQ